MNRAVRNRPFSASVIFCLSLVILAFSDAYADTPADLTPSDVGRSSLEIPEGHPIWISPAVSLDKRQMNFGGTSINPGHESANALEVGVRLISSSNRTRSLLVGVDLREWLAQIDGQSGLNAYGTKLGIRLEYRPESLPLSGFGFSWFFGDTLVVRARDRQFNGNSGAVFASYQLGTLRWFVEGGMGSYNEGPGFILISRTPGTDSMSYTSVQVGAEFPISSIWPEWLKYTQPRSPVLP